MVDETIVDCVMDCESRFDRDMSGEDLPFEVKLPLELTLTLASSCLQHLSQTRCGLIEMVDNTRFCFEQLEHTKHPHIRQWCRVDDCMEMEDKLQSNNTRLHN